MTMDPRLQAWLDGEIELDDLPAEMRDEASTWTAVLEGVRDLPAPGAADGATRRIMAAVTERPGGRTAPGAGRMLVGRMRAGLDWLVRPRPVRMPPLAGAVLVALAAWGVLRLAAGGIGFETGDTGRTAAVAEDEVGATVYVQFVIAAPGARTVALAGDFNEWTPSIELSDPDRDGVWSARVALEAGMHEYMFVIDGTEWRPDPNALSYAEDGFGRRNSVLAVAPLDET